VKAIGRDAFSGCTGLISLIIKNPIPPTVLHNEKIVDHETNRACLYVPKGSINAYRIADGWRDFRCIEEINEHSMVINEDT
jgi:hypothetical protein